MIPVQQIVSGQAVGSAISVSDSTVLAQIGIGGLTIGTQVFNAAVGGYFILTVSSAALVTDQVVAVAGVDGWRWVISTGGVIAPGSIPLTDLASQATHTFVANATGGGASPTAINGTTAVGLLPSAAAGTAGVIPTTGLPLGTLPATQFHSYCTLGTNSSVTPSHVTATGVKIGDKVVMVANVTDHISSAASFEATVTVADQIQQSGADLSAKTLVFLVIAQS
jgi:hypothetical protein